MSVKLIICPACENKVSSQAVACPHCGQPIRPALKLVKHSNNSDIAADKQSVTTKQKAWTPIGSNYKKGVCTSIVISNVKLLPDTILQRIRSAFESNSLSTRQTEYKDGTATTVGGFAGGDGEGGLIGGVTSINKKTWNPFIATSSNNFFLAVRVTTLTLRQRNRAFDGVSTQLEHDIELQAKIEIDDRCKTVILVCLSIISFFLSVFYGITNLTSSHSNGDVELKTIGCIIVSIIISAIISDKILPLFFWTNKNVKNMQGTVNKVLSALKDELQ